MHARVSGVGLAETGLLFWRIAGCGSSVGAVEVGGRSPQVLPECFFGARDVGRQV